MMSAAALRATVFQITTLEDVSGGREGQGVQGILRNPLL